MDDALQVQTLERSEFESRAGLGGLTVFRYTPNNRGFIFLQICAALLFIIGYTVYLITEFDPRYWAVASFLLGALAIGLIAMVVYWTIFAKRSAVAFDDDALFVVTVRRVERIPWPLVTATAAGFNEQHQDGNHGTLNMHLGGRTVVLRLFNPFVWVDDFPTFLVELLSQIKNNEKDDISDDLPASSEH